MFALFLFFSLSSKAQLKIRIDPAHAYGGTVSEYLDTVEYILLETTKESLFGDALYQIFTNKSIVVYDYDTRSVLFFDLQGKFLTKITEKNKYMNIAEDKSSNSVVVIISDPYRQKEEFKYYTFLGKPIKSESKIIDLTALKNQLPIGNGYIAKSHYCTLAINQKTPKDTTVKLIDIYKGDSLIKSYLPYNQKEHLAFWKLQGYIRFPNIVQNGAFYISTPLNYQLYRVTKDSIKRIGKFIFPADRTIPKQVVESKDLSFLDHTWDVLHSSNQKIIGVSNIFFLKNKLFFKIDVGTYTSYVGTGSKDIYNFIYDTLTRRLVSFERILPDAMNYYLPLFGRDIELSGISYNNGYFYSMVSSLNLFSAKEKTEKKNPKYPPLLQKYFKTQDRKSNPVLVRMKLKGF